MVNLAITGLATVGETLTVTSATTLTGALDANGGASIDNIQIGVTGDNEIDTASGNLTIDSAIGITSIDDDLVVTGTAQLGASGGATTVEWNFRSRWRYNSYIWNSIKQVLQLDFSSNWWWESVMILYQ